MAERIAADLIAFALLAETVMLAFGSGFHSEEVLGVALALAVGEVWGRRP